MKVNMEIKLKPFNTPNYVLVEGEVGERQDGLVQNKKFKLSELDGDTLSALCEQFVKDIYKKAGK